jgi:sugar lactone lactonase YvrE
MIVLARSRSAVCIGAALALLAGCGGSQPPIGAPGSAVQRSAATTPNTGYAHSAPLLYVSNANDYDDVKVYPANDKDPSPIAVISDNLDTPVGDCISADGTLYVANEPAGAGWVTEFAAGKMKSSEVITKGINTPAFCAIDANENLWVTNIGGQNATEYEKGSTKPHTIITKGLFYPDGIAIDRSGNMYVANHYTEGTKSFAPGNVVVYPAGSKLPKRIITNGVTSPVGIAVDAKGTLYVANNKDNNVEVYRSGESQPYHTLTAGVNDPVAVAVNRAGWLYVTNEGNRVVIEFAPDSLKPSGRQISKGLGLGSPFGTAYFPPLLR